MADRHYSLEISHLQRMELAITQLWEQVAAIPFRHEVRSEDVPDYYSVVNTPMSLSTVLGKLNRKEYLNPNTVRGDMDVLFKNCFTYNMPGCPIYNYGKQLKKSFEELLVQVGLEGRKRPAPRRYEEFSTSLRYNFVDDADNGKRGKRIHHGVAVGLRPFKQIFSPKIVGGEVKRRAVAPEFPASPSAHEDDDEADEADEVEEGKEGKEGKEAEKEGEADDEDAAPAAPPSPAGADAAELGAATKSVDDGASDKGAAATTNKAVGDAGAAVDASKGESKASSAGTEADGNGSPAAKEKDAAAVETDATTAAAATETEVVAEVISSAMDEDEMTAESMDGVKVASPKKQASPTKKQAAAQKRPQRNKGKKGAA